MRVAVNGWFHGRLATGSGQYLAGLASALPGAGPGHEFVLVCAAGMDLPARDLPGWASVTVATPFDRLNRNLAKLWFEQVAFPRACRRLGADVALVPYWGAPWDPPCPVAVTVHDLIPLLLPLYRGGPLQRAYTALVSRTARRADAVLADSEAGRRDLVTHLGIQPDRVHVVRLAASTDFRPVSDREVLARVRARYGLPADPFLLYMGGFDARKNVVRMLEGYARLCRALPDAPALVVAGKLPGTDTPFTPDPLQHVERLGISQRVHFAGWVDEADKPALYSQAMATLYLSEYEGFGLPVLEAMGCGCAVIASGN